MFARLSSALLLIGLADTAFAGSGTFDNNVTNTGHLDVTVDDYGSFGRWVGPNDSDNFWPPMYQRADPMTNVSENLLFIYEGGKKGAIALTSHALLNRLLEGSQGDGIAGDYANLTRTVLTGITVTNDVATSKFRIAETTANIQLDIDLRQQFVTEAPPASRLEQDYTITNTGTTDVLLVWHTVWDMNVIFESSNADDDIVGVGSGRCYVYMHDPTKTSHGGALADGGSEAGLPGALTPLPVSAYVGAKEGQSPQGSLTPLYSVPTSAVPMQEVWKNFKMPVSWVNTVANVGKDIEGFSAVSAPAAVALEYQFTLAVGQVAIIRTRRHWGTIALPCATVPVTCGNDMLDANEACDSGVTDTADCNALLCTRPMCGDNYPNAAAGEQCESNGVDSADCDARACTTPSCGDGYLNPAAGEMCDEGVDSATCNLANCQPPVCGDGIVNAAAGEECEGGTLCDDACKVEFTVGGGCAGCGSSGTSATGDGSALALLAFAGLLGRRRKQAPVR